MIYFEANAKVSKRPKADISRRSLIVNTQADTYLGVIMKRYFVFFSALLVLVIPRISMGDARVESNVIYSMYSGLALLMDVHHPDNPNGYGIVKIGGNGFHSPLSPDARSLKEQSSEAATELLERGYTLFSINHRTAPRFRYPAAVEDAQRAVRFVRYHAERYGIDPNRIGAFGVSSGGYLVSMLGVLDGNGDAESTSLIDRESAKVQVVAAMCPATDLAQFVSGEGGDKAVIGSFIGARLRSDPESEEALLYAQASPTNHVTPDDPPFLLIHGDADQTVPYSQSQLLEAGLTKQGVTAELITIPGGGHGAWLSGEYFDDIADWFDTHLRDASRR